MRHTQVSQCLGSAVGLLCTLFYVTVAEACLLAYDSAAPLSQGTGLARLSAQGGSHSFAANAGGRLGLNGDREVHLRLGGCQRSAVGGFAFETGLIQRLIAHDSDPHSAQAILSGPIDLSLRASLNAFKASRADQDRDARVDMGMQSALLISYPFSISPKQRGSVSIAAGVGVATSDRRVNVELMDEDSTSNERRLSSSWVWSELVAISASVEVIERLPIALELRWQDDGVTAGGSVGYLF